MEHFSTLAIPSAARFRQWRDAVCRYYPRVDLESEFSDDFAGAISTRLLGSMRVTQVSSGPQRVRRSAREIASDRDDILQLNFQTSGEGFVSQDGRQCVTRPGTFVLYDSTRPYELRFKARFEQISVKLPRHRLRSGYGNLDDFTARAVDGTTGPGRFLFAFVMQAVMHGDERDDRLLSDRLQDHFSDLLMTALSSVPALASTADRFGRSATLVRVKTYILSHLRDPELSPATVARAVGMSQRSLYALFEQEETTLWRWVQSCRLSRCKANLEDRSFSCRSISDIAYSWGFSDAAHFSRLFRKAYGISPKDCRHNHPAVARHMSVTGG